MSTPTHDRHIADLERDLATAIAERDAARRMLAECERERDRFRSALMAIVHGCTGVAQAIASAALDGGPHKAGEAK